MTRKEMKEFKKNIKDLETALKHLKKIPYAMHEPSEEKVFEHHNAAAELLDCAQDIHKMVDTLI